MKHEGDTSLVMALCVGLTGLTGFAAESGSTDASASAAASALARAARGMERLQGWYNAKTGLWETTGWWNSANALTVLVDYSRVSGTKTYRSAIENTYQQAPKTYTGFINEFHDDEGWWALAWIDAYDLTGDRRYLKTAETIFADMAGGWDATCGGGIWWSKEKKYKNAIANELFLSVAAKLAHRDKAQARKYLDWANREWGWFAQSGMINGDGLINDGLKITKDEKGAEVCRNNGETAWSYNQGVVLDGLVELARLNPDDSLPRTAERIAGTATAKLVDGNGVLHDVCEPKCGADGVQFKGIFVRNLLELHKAYPRASYAAFLRTNAENLWTRSRDAETQFGQVWSGKYDSANAGSQSSALDALVAAASLEKTR